MAKTQSTEETKKKTAEEVQEEIHTLALERFKEIQDYEGSERIVMEDDKKFSIGEDDDQWNPDDVTSRKNSRRSFLTIMRSNQFTDFTKNQARQSKASIKISPTDSGANEKFAERRQGLVRQIQYESIASQARQAAFDDSVDEGRGHYIVKTEFIEGTFNQKIIVEPIKDARSVYMDWRRQRPDYSDCEYGFVINPLEKTLYETKYPDFPLNSWESNQKQTDFWQTEKDVMIADYYCKMFKTRTLIEVAGVGREEGQTKILFEDEVKEELSDERILQKREVEDPYWMYYKMSGQDILEEKELPWKEIPICTVIGKEDNLNGRFICKGLIRDIKAPLRLYNFVSSNEADIIAKAPRAPWVGAAGQFEGFETQYANSNVSDEATLEYNMVSLNGSLAPAPQRAQFSVDLSNLTQQKMSILEDLRAITGINQASLGEKSNEVSGVAIRQKASQANTANFHYPDNLAMCINHEARVINSGLSVIYDTKRTITLRDDEEEETIEEINGEGDEGLGDGNFNVTTSITSNFNTQREEEAAGLIEMSSKSAAIQEIGMGKVVRAQDWFGKDGLADLMDAFTAMKYPQLADQLNKKGQDDEIGVLTQQLQQAQQQLGQMQQQMQQLQEQLQKADADKQAAAAGKIQVEMEKLKLDQQRVQLEGQKIAGELQLKAKELEQDMLKTDLTVSSQQKIAEDGHQVELIKVHADTQKSDKVIQVDLIKEQNADKRALMPANVEKPDKEEKEEKKPKEVKSAPITVNVDASPAKKKSSVITPNGKGGYDVKTVEGD